MINLLRKSLTHTMLLLGILTVHACSDEQSYATFDNSVTSETPNKYFEFFNQQSQLAAGYYTIIVATKNIGVTADFNISIEKNDGSISTTRTSSWSNSVGESSTPWTTCLGSSANTCFNLELSDASGVKITVSSNEDAVLYLVNQHDLPTLLTKQDSGGIGQTEVINYSIAQIRESSYSQAYYAAVDSQNQRDTFQKYKTLHDFNNPDVVHVTFRDSKDLGYGRDMYMRSYHSNDCGGQQVIAFYVRNFKVDVVDGFAYGLVNLEAAINEDLPFHFGSNAIEFSKGFDSLGETCADEAYTRFFTFKSDYSSPNADHPRLDQVDLDGRGEKAMPQPCVSCHGGKLRPLDRFNRFVAINVNDSSKQIGDTKSQFQAFEVDTFEFSDKDNKTKADFEDGLRILNSAVFCSYAGSAGHSACTDFGNGVPIQLDNGEWSGDFAREMMLGAYDNKLEVVGTAYKEGFVPEGWKPKAGLVPEGADTLFTKVIARNCFVCHGNQGSSLGSNRNANSSGKDINFSSWEKFISHAEEIQQRVFAEGRMPLGLLNYTDFWDDPTKAELLAAFISPYVDDFSKHVDDEGNIIMPGKAIARAGLDRTTKINSAITLNANSSLFIDTYEWEVLSKPSSSTVSLSSLNNKMVEFEADVVGTYELKLTVSNSVTYTTDTDHITILVDNSLLKAPRELVFYNDIKDTLATCATDCHSLTGSTTLNVEAKDIPVFWSDDADQPHPIPSTLMDAPSLGLYELFKARINLNDIEDSLVLKKPTNIHHFGGPTAKNLGFNTDEQIGSINRNSYDMIVNWISEGATCGGSLIQCPGEQ